MGGGGRSVIAVSPREPVPGERCEGRSVNTVSHSRHTQADKKENKKKEAEGWKEKG